MIKIHMKVGSVHAALLSIVVIVFPASADPEAAKAELHARLEREFTDFCKTVHKSVPTVAVSTSEIASSGSSGYPDLVFKYKNVGCEGVENAALQQGGYCGLSMDGMVCAVKTFAYTDGRYEEISMDLQGVFE